MKQKKRKHYRARRPRIGSILAGRTVLAVAKYTGRYPQWFAWVVTLTSPYTESGKIEMAL